MRTIILQEVPTPSGGSTYWAINESGHVIDGLGTDELLWCVACTLRPAVGALPYGGGKTVEEAKIEAFRDGALCGLTQDITAIEARARATLAPGANAFIKED